MTKSKILDELNPPPPDGLSFAMLDEMDKEITAANAPKDLIERLRSIAISDFTGPDFGDGMNATGHLLMEAAEEIENLRRHEFWLRGGQS